jgi:hypothetical protein
MLSLIGKSESLRCVIPRPRTKPPEVNVTFLDLSHILI